MSSLHAALLAQVVSRPHQYPENTYSGRGVVICAGGMRYLPPAWVCVNMLRKTGCVLPIEMWHLDDDEVPPEARTLFEPLGVTFVNASRVREHFPVRILSGWELKPYAIIHSRFAEVLFLDADNVPVRDPTPLFDCEPYHRHGTIFWPDYWRLAEDRSIWKLMGMPYRDEREFESGQIVIDKARCWNALAVAMHLNEHSDFYYQHIHGDKETFHMAWRKVEQEYAMPERGVMWLEGTMCQHDFNGMVVFQHRNIHKWALDGNVQVPGFDCEPDCLALVEEFKDRWRDARLARMSGVERNFYNHVVTLRHFTYVRIGYDERPVELLDNFSVGYGRAVFEQRWDIGEVGGEPALVLRGLGKDTCVLRKTTNKLFEGRWLVHERMPIRLVAFTATELDPVAKEETPVGVRALAIKDELW